MSIGRAPDVRRARGRACSRSAGARQFAEPVANKRLRHLLPPAVAEVDALHRLRDQAAQRPLRRPARGARTRCRRTVRLPGPAIRAARAVREPARTASPARTRPPRASPRRGRRGSGRHRRRSAFRVRCPGAPRPPPSRRLRREQRRVGRRRRSGPQDPRVCGGDHRVPRVDARRREGSDELVETPPPLGVRARQTAARPSAVGPGPPSTASARMRRNSTSTTSKSSGASARSTRRRNRRGSAAIRRCTCSMTPPPPTTRSLSQIDVLVDATVGLYSSADVDDDLVAGELRRHALARCGDGGRQRGQSTRRAPTPPMPSSGSDQSVGAEVLEHLDRPAGPPATAPGGRRRAAPRGRPATRWPGSPWRRCRRPRACSSAAASPPCRPFHAAARSVPSRSARSTSALR